MNREILLSEAIERCMKELYSYAQPAVEWADFEAQNKEYNKKHAEWEEYMRSKEGHPDWDDKTEDECIGPRPFEFYYLPEDVMNIICDSYIDSYELNKQENLKDIKDILIGYCKEPVVFEYATDEDGKAYKAYKRINGIEDELKTVFGNDKGEEAWNIMLKYLNMATDFYKWNRELSMFSSNIYLGASPHSVKKTVIENWKKYRGKDIEIDDGQYENFENKYYDWEE